MPHLPLPGLITKQLLGVVGGCLHGCHSAGELRGLGIEEQGQQLRVQVQWPKINGKERLIFGDFD